MIADNQWVVNQHGQKIRKRFENVSRFGVASDDGCIHLGLERILQNPGVGILQPIIRRKALLENGIRYRPEFKYGEDYRFIYDLVRSGAKLGFVDEPLYYAELVEGSLTSKRVPMYSGMIDVLNSIKEDLSREGERNLHQHVDQAIKNCKRTLAYGAVVDPLKRKQYLQAFKAMLEYPQFWTQLPGRLASLIHRR
ncbi:hypothetical protein Mal65_51120 [Crateriforma conspicua]|nr:hypothetical protein Mal65_51120 [Crateriforma conspicua]